MKLFDLYYGMTGGFNSYGFQQTVEASSLEEAEQMAYDLAVEEYQSYEGYHGIMDWAECREELGEDATDEDVDDYYREQIEGWIDWSAKEHDPENPPEEE